jgi:hypothetical protein
MNMPIENDPLWEMAKKRVGFKKHLIAYLLMNLLLWGIYFLSNSSINPHIITPSPIWVTFFWGIGLLFNYVEVYLIKSHTTVEKEYNQLKNKF